MERVSFLCFFLLICCSHLHLTAQPAQDAKRDFVWLFGYDSNLSDPTFGGTVVEFNQMPPDTYYQNRPMNLRATDASICDKNGNLLFYANGAYIANKEHDQMENGGGLSPGIWTDEYADYGLILPQGALILPFPEHPNLFIVFHSRMDVLPSPVGPCTSHVYYSIVDMEGDGGNGAVIEKNLVAVEDTLDLGKINAVRHANGRDWWVLVAEFDSNRYYRFLVSPNGVEDYGVQEVGTTALHGLGQAAFSPDGSKFVRYDGVNLLTGNYLNFYDFDRCTGTLSNHLKLHVIDTAYSAGMAISPNSRFAYFSSYNYIYQYDLWASDIAASKVVVAVYDGYVTQPPLPPLPTRFFLAQLAPDGKIYVSCNNSVNVLHVIHSPDEKGLACNVEQHGVLLPTLNGYSMPHFPHFRLGALEGSPCDTIVVSAAKESVQSSTASIFPNPVQGHFTITFNGPMSQRAVFYLFDNLGRLCLREELIAHTNDCYAGSLQPGVYFYEIFAEEEKLYSGKLIKIK